MKVDWTEVYEDGDCPDCGLKIPVDAVDGDDCSNCGHVFYARHYLIVK